MLISKLQIFKTNMNKKKPRVKQTLKKSTKKAKTTKKPKSTDWFDYLRINYNAFDIMKTNR